MIALRANPAMLFGIVASVLGYAAIGLANRSWMLYVLVFPFALEGLIEPSTKALLTREVGATEQGELQGSLGSLLSMTSIVGPIAGTALFARFAPAEASPHVPGAVFLAGALLNVIGLLLAVRLFARRAPAPASSRGPDE